MYQNYYAKGEYQIPDYKQKVSDVFIVERIRPTMWEEHCLECSAPLCFKNCVHFEARVDGRCKRFYDGMWTYENAIGCCGQGMHIRFRKWANMMTIIFPSLLSNADYLALTRKNQKLGGQLHSIAYSRLPIQLRWNYIRTREYLRRRDLRKAKGNDNKPDAFIFHGYSFNEESFNLVIEIYNEGQPKFRYSLPMNQGENLFVIPAEKLDAACWTENNLVKVYPENDIEAEMDILWCDYVKGTAIESDKPAAQVKCVAWDLDNTLWDGILIETEDPSKLRLKTGVKELIEELDRRGIIQTIASKNDFDPAWEVVKGLGVADCFLYPQIHWNAKSESIRQVAEALNIGIDTFALIDDSVFERNQVVSVLPQVRVYDSYESILDNPEFDVPITEESKNRRLMYKAEEKRNQIKQTDNLDTIEFLKKCELQISMFEPESPEEIERSYELVVRTNQLNMSGKKYTREEFDNVLHMPGYHNFAFSCKDLYGAYGTVGFGQYRNNNGTLTFSEYAMSCRVAGKYVESALFSSLLNRESCTEGSFKVIKTKKNTLLRRTLEEIGFTVDNEDDKTVDYRFTADLVNKDLVRTSDRSLGNEVI